MENPELRLQCVMLGANRQHMLQKPENTSPEILRKTCSRKGSIKDSEGKINNVRISCGMVNLGHKPEFFFYFYVSKSA